MKSTSGKTRRAVAAQARAGEAPARGDAAVNGISLAHDAYPLRTVSRLTGLTPDLIRAWERRYGVVAPVRGPRGAWLYGASAANEQEVAALLEALRAFDGAAMERMLGEAVVVYGVREFIGRVGVPLLVRIGELWKTGELSVAEEHVASSAIQSLFGGLFRQWAPRRPPSILLAAPSGERHELGLSMVAPLCLQAGLAVTYAGVELWIGGSDADAVAAGLGRTRAVTHTSLATAEAAIRRVAATEVSSPSRPSR